MKSLKDCLVEAINEAGQTMFDSDYDVSSHESKLDDVKAYKEVLGIFLKHLEGKERFNGHCNARNPKYSMMEYRFTPPKVDIEEFVKDLEDVCDKYPDFCRLSNEGMSDDEPGVKIEFLPKSYQFKYRKDFNGCVSYVAGKNLGSLSVDSNRDAVIVAFHVFKPILNVDY
jgi:hypothetical protein